MKKLACALVCAVGALAPAAARAYDNDLELHKLGAPDRVVAGDAVVEKDAFAQERFARFSTEFGLAITPGPADLNASVGDAGFSIGFTPQVALVHRKQTFSDGLERDVWPTTQTGGGALFLPTLHLRKGLPFSLEIGTDVTWVSFSTMVAMSASVKWAILEGFQWLPDVSVRAFGATALGTGPFNVVTGGWDVGGSYRFPIAGGAEAALYGGYQRMGLNASTNNIDFNPGKEDAVNPTTDDSVFSELEFGPVFSPSTKFQRIYFGAQVRFGVLVVGVDAMNASGENRIGDDSNTTVSTSLFKVAGRLGVWF